jgi:hypothetical protein
MPFKSEAQRKYLWANEPEIARDWTDTYGSRIQRDNGGIMRVPFAEAGSTNWDSNLLDLNTTGIKGQEIMDNWKRNIQSLRGQIRMEKEQGIDTTFNESQLRNLENKFKGGVFDKNPKSSLPKERGWFKELFGIGEAEGAELGSPAENQMRKEFFDYGTQQADIGDTAYSNLKVPGLDVKYPKGIETIDKSEFIDDANYIPKWNEYTDDPEYDEEEGEDYSVGKQISPFKQWSRNFWANPGQRLMQGANMLWNPFGEVARWGTGAALQGGQGLREGLAGLRRGLPSQNAYEQARQNRILQGRKEYMMGRREKGLDYGNLANVFQQLGEEDTWVPPQIRKPTAPTTYIHQPTGPQQQNGGGGIPSVARDLGMRGSYDHGWT